LEGLLQLLLWRQRLPPLPQARPLLPLRQRQPQRPQHLLQQKQHWL
jgi:hypothetical protein